MKYGSEVFSLKKKSGNLRNLVYVYLNETDQYVLSYGIEFAEFMSSLSNRINYLLLLKHQFDDGELNVHTLLEYVPSENFKKIISDDVYSYGDFCWIDFEEVDGLNECSGQEIAEFLYLGHLKTHLKPPFYNQLRNRFVYLAHDDGWWNKVYYRNLKDFYRMLGEVVVGKLSEQKLEKSFFLVRKQRELPNIGTDIILNLKMMMKEGILISIKDVRKTRASLEIPIWILGGFDNMDDMYEEYEKIRNDKCDVKLIFDKKSKEWKLAQG